MPADVDKPLPEIEGTRDLKNIERALEAGLKTPGFVMPKNWQHLPATMFEVLTAQHPNDHEEPSKRGQYKYSTRARQIAYRLLLQTVRLNLLINPPAKEPTEINLNVSGSIELADVKGLSDDELKTLVDASELIQRHTTPQEN